MVSHVLDDFLISGKKYPGAKSVLKTRNKNHSAGRWSMLTRLSGAENRPLIIFYRVFASFWVSKKITEGYSVPDIQNKNPISRGWWFTHSYRSCGDNWTAQWVFADFACVRVPGKNFQIKKVFPIPIMRTIDPITPLLWEQLGSS